MTADAVGYLLALTAVLAAVRALAHPSLRAQSLFLAAAALATFARLQYAALVIAVALAAAIVERGRPGALIRRHALLVAAPLAGAAVIIGQGVGGYYESVLSFRISAGTVGWLPISMVLLAVAAGIIIVPGAVVWTVSQIVRPTDQARLAFAAVGALSLTLLLVASALFASETASNRFYERYLMIGIPLAAVAFCCWIAEARPLRGIWVAIAAFLVVAAARVPISEYAVGEGMADSPLLSAVNRLEGAIDVGNASLLVALAATACAVLAVATALGKVGSGRRSRDNSRSADGCLGRRPCRRPAALGVRRLGRTTRRAGLGRRGRRQECPPGAALRERHAGGNAAGASQLLDWWNCCPRAARPAIRRGYAGAQRQ